MTAQGLHFKVRGWTPQKTSWTNFVAKIVIELKGRIAQSISKTWISDQFHKFKLERSGSEKVYRQVRNVIDEVLTSLEMTDLLRKQTNFTLKTQIKKNMSLFLHKSLTDSKITSEFKIESESGFTTYQITFAAFEGEMGDIVGCSKYYDGKNSISSSRIFGGNEFFPELMFRIISEILKTDLKIEKVKLISASFRERKEQEGF